MTEVNNKKILLNILDTPGFKETKKDAKLIRNDERLLDMIFSCIDENMANIDVFCIVHNVKEKLTNEIMEVFKLLTVAIDDTFKQNCVLLLTHSESKFIPGRKPDLIEEYIQKKY